jgi:hypothetical protein
VTYTAGPPGVCSVAGTTITMIGVGTCVITAHQASGGLFAAATPVSQNVALQGQGSAVQTPVMVPAISAGAVIVLVLLFVIGTVLFRQR